MRAPSPPLPPFFHGAVLLWQASLLPPVGTKAGETDAELVWAPLDDLENPTAEAAAKGASAAAGDLGPRPAGGADGRARGRCGTGP